MKKIYKRYQIIFLIIAVGLVVFYFSAQEVFKAGAQTLTTDLKNLNLTRPDLVVAYD